MAVSKPRKILLIGSDASRDAEKLLVGADCCVVTVSTGAAAVGCVKYNMFDAAVLVSTGREMDLAETALNLRDIQPSLEIIILIDPAVEAKELAAQADALVHAIPRSRILTRPELNDHVAASH